ncbi:hypothetical protein EIN_046420 [Entamoeba invadens IP1]|uniref:PB1 domain-containing protein n=1 Tax=Entamoeba invadens IP1 TaxID=370355 RepID=A0A0A1UD85_ENTIV|nr:hypothetical protein EIN_046420 [Entamoeba invadens IP1]ELP94399.1 hypothetical protein EIN_046420 [Entamoeba invadens IP1]|eukprot:XP_004261170.1 hypothetical protein EIN_046420 [Entamoeba invadens IP1]
MVLFKLEYMNDIRVVDLSTLDLNSLYTAFQNKFNLTNMRLRPRFLLKYLDAEGDWVTLCDDDDLVLALKQANKYTLRLKLVDSYQTANSSSNEEWDLRPIFAQLMNTPSIQNNISKMVENILLTTNQVVEVRTKPGEVKMPDNFTAHITETLPALGDDDGLL